MTHIVQVPLGERAYAVHVGSGLLAQVGILVRQAIGDRRLFLVYDEAVAQPWAAKLIESLKSGGFSLESASVPSGEGSKCVTQIEQLWEQMARLAFTRDTAIIAMGGGVVGDLAGFLAASFLRGIPFIQIPTTLLAMVDSSVGGKTGINLAAGKNLVGSFWQPALVVADTDTLSTLPKAELRSGMAEVIKYGVIRDPGLFSWLEQMGGDIPHEDLAETVRRSVLIKAEVVAGDERETSGLRAILNFGHTLGHAIEAEGKYTAFRHGEAIAIGMVAASLLALVQDDGWTQSDHNRLVGLLEKTGLPTRLPASYLQDRIIERTRVDKKAVSGQVRYVLPTRIGHVEVVKTVSEDSVRWALEQIREPKGD
jgi:3-dehydroquinate synthase